MSKVERELVSEETYKSVSNYVHKNYKQYKDKNLFITESNSCYYVAGHKNESPLILSKVTFS